MTLAATSALLGCSKESIEERYSLRDGCLATVVRQPGPNSWDVYSLRVTDANGHVIHNEGLGAPPAYYGSFLLDEEGTVLVVRLDDETRTHVTTYLHAAVDHRSDQGSEHQSTTRSESKSK